MTGALASSRGGQLAEIVYHGAILNLLCKTQPSNRTKLVCDSTELSLQEITNNVEPIYLSNYTKRDVVTARIENRQDLRIHIDKAKKTGALLNQILLRRQRATFKIYWSFLSKATDADENDAGGVWCSG